MAERPRIYRTRGVVLKRTDLGEADKILTIYSYSSGKLRAVAKGVRRPSSKLGGHVDDLSYSDMLLARGRDLDVVTQSQTIDTFRGMREDLWRVSCGYYLTELVDSFNEDRIENHQLFELLVSSLQRLSQGDDLFTTVHFFELHMLEMVGYRPELTHCLSCRHEIKPETNYFGAILGGVLCPECGRREGTAQPISLGALKVLRYLQRLDAPPSGGLRLDVSTRREVDSTLRLDIEHLLERTLKSNAFLDRLRLEDMVTKPT
ncbi:MAG TPA: DNA repair protein RecO [Chloroflexota bacterium]|nr:DNA repair protein RecO [Chloroflexota bacterium]